MLVCAVNMFEYENELHNVLEVEKSAYDSPHACNPMQEYNRISLFTAGTRYFHHFRRPISLSRRRLWREFHIHPCLSPSTGTVSIDQSKWDLKCGGFFRMNE